MLRRSKCIQIFRSSVQYNDGLLPDIILFKEKSEQLMLLPSSGSPFKCHEEVLSLQPMIPLKRFDIFPPDWGMLRRSRIQQTVHTRTFSKVSVVCINNR